MEKKVMKNSLSTLPVNQLLRQFAVPSIIAMLVGALYNIIDQFFIGQSVGELGNAATNIAFPLSTACIAAALMFGIGGAACFNLAMGRKKPEDAAYYIGNAVTMIFVLGFALCLLVQLFLDPMLKLFGSPDNVLAYARPYARITSLGFPFLILSTGGGHLIRGDGSPKFTMACNITGAVINTVLNALFVFGLDWGMKGAALATIIGQIVSGIMAIWYFKRFKTVKLRRCHFRPHRRFIKTIISLGAAPLANQLAMLIVQVVVNNSLTYYGSMSVYGEAIPLACCGIIMKVNQMFFSFPIGLAQGMQPIASFNYGAEQYDRVKQVYLKTCTYGLVVALFFFVLFQGLPREIISLFGKGSPEYFDFGVRFFRIFLFFTFLNFLQPITSNFFTAVGKPAKGMFLSLTRQILFFLPLLIIMPRIFGIDGILYTGPIADSLSGITAITLAIMELRSKKYSQRD